VEEIAGTKLYITKEMLSEAAEEEYYNSDLEGFKILDDKEKLHGHILEMHNFGAGDIIEMRILDKKDTIFNDTMKNSIKSLEQEEKIFLTV
jgi:16S rRNA processing protein RimM